MSKSGKARWLPSRSDALWVGILGLLIAAATAFLSAWLLPKRPDDEAAPRTALLAAASVLFGGVSGILITWLKYRLKLLDSRKLALTHRAFGGLADQQDIRLIDLGVHKSIRDATDFLERDIFPEVRQSIAEGKPTLIVGPSMAGKTRLAVEAVRSALPSHRIFRTAEPGDLVKLLMENIEISDCIVWLDDLDEYLNTGLNVGHIDALKQQKNVLVATMRAVERDRLDTSASIKPAGWNVPGLFEEFRLDSQLSDAEQDRLSESAYLDLEHVVTNYGLAEYLGGAPVVWGRFDRGRRTHPLGWAAVRAAVDWRRVVGSAIPKAALTELYSLYVSETRGRQLTDEDLAWATKEVNQTVAVLVPQGDDRLMPFDYLMDRGELLEADPPRALFDLVLRIDFLEPAEYGAAASHASGLKLFDRAIELWQRVEASGDPTQAAFAALYIGVIQHEEVGDKILAIASYRRAFNLSEDHDLRGMISANLAACLADSGDVDEAMKIVSAALVKPVTDWVAAGLQHAKADMHERLGQLDQSEIALRAAFELPSPRKGSVGLALGILLEERGRPAEACEVWRLALGVEEISTAERSELLYRYGAALDEQGHVEAAIALFEEAVSLGDADFAPTAAIRLGILHSDRGDFDAARRAYKIAQLSGDPIVSGKGLVLLAMLDQDEGDLNSALTRCRAAAESDVEEVRSLALLALSGLLESEGDVLGAIGALQAAAKFDDPELAARGHFQLATFSIRRSNDPGGAGEQSLRFALENGDKETAGNAAFMLGTSALDSNDYQTAEELLARGSEDADPQMRDAAQRSLRYARKQLAAVRTADASNSDDQIQSQQRRDGPRQG